MESSSKIGSRVTSFTASSAGSHAIGGGLSGLHVFPSKPLALVPLTSPPKSNSSLAICPKKPSRILLVDPPLALGELHLALMRSIPAIIEILASCDDLYFHHGQSYALVIFVLRPESMEVAEAAQFIRHRWSEARILLLGNEAATIDDWLYDERVDPCLPAITLRDVVIRLVTREKTWAQLMRPSGYTHF